jgi:hypothetical protein
MVVKQSVMPNAVARPTLERVVVLPARVDVSLVFAKVVGAMRLLFLRVLISMI